ncbi:hypothetical protein MJO29_013393 [Puccinia striiformis f. sp. tritici]|nr:hypothetical protein MJO29_013393 [Puccinia striiformis f. sp. tritici]
MDDSHRSSLGKLTSMQALAIPGFSVGQYLRSFADPHMFSTIKLSDDFPCSVWVAFKSVNVLPEDRSACWEYIKHGQFNLDHWKQLCTKPQRELASFASVDLAKMKGVNHPERRTLPVQRHHHLVTNTKSHKVVCPTDLMGSAVFLLDILPRYRRGLQSVSGRLLLVKSVNLHKEFPRQLFIVRTWLHGKCTDSTMITNRNVSLALLLIRIISPVRFVLYITAQLMASIVASAVLHALLPGPLNVSTTLGAGTSPAQGLFIEGFITCGLVLSVLFLAVEKHKATFLAPIGIGITLFAGHLFALVYTGAGMNTARSFGPAVVSGFPSEHWIYWVGPTLGSLFAVGIYAFMKLFRYWKFSEAQDTDISSRSPELFSQLAGPVGGLAGAADLEKNEAPGTNNSERVRWPHNHPIIQCESSKAVQTLGV